MSEIESLIPKAGLEAWHESDTMSVSSGNVTGMADKSDNDRGLNCASSYPTNGSVTILGRSIPAVSFSGSNNPLQNVEALTGKHFFVIGSYTDATFAADAPGLLTDLSTLPILTGTASGTKFIDLTSYYGSFTYRRRDVILAAGSMNAAMSGAVSIYEVVIPSGAAMDGIQFGRDRTTAARKWKGKFLLDLIYSRVLSDDERRSIYEYIAMKYLLWTQTPAGLDVFPFQPDWGLPLALDKRVLSSRSVAGTNKSRVKSGAKKGFEPHFEDRWPEEFDAAEAFWNSKYPGTSFIYRDIRFSPERDTTVEFAGGLPHNATGHRDINYSFQAGEV